MDETELRQLQDPDNREDEVDPLRPPVSFPRASDVVGFSSAEFQRIARHPRRQGLSTAAFLRRAALDRVPAEETAAVVGAAPPNPR